jgi:hypothetical protein
MVLLATLTLLATFAAALPALAVDDPTPAPVPAEPTPAPYDWPNGDPCPLPDPRPTAPPPDPGAPPDAPPPTPRPLPLCPAEPSANPIDLLAWLFTPIFQGLFLTMVVFYRFTGDIGIAIIALTLIIKTILIPLFRRQIVSQRRMQMLQPEMRAIQQKFKGNRAKISEETMRLYRERGINPAAGCLPAVLQLFLLIRSSRRACRRPISARCCRSSASR